MAAERMFIVGFMHVCMINNWLEIITEQLEIMKDSGLYDEMRVLNVGAVGNEENLRTLQSFVKRNRKLDIAVYSDNLSAYEFHTLRFLKDVVDRGTNFYGFYIHTKGVSYPGHHGGKYWRDYMNHYNLREWKECVRHLHIGYETCGVKYINKKWPAHYSGNFFWFKSEYAKTLLPVDKMNLKDRFNAEMWICSGKAIAATLCQDFVDYNTQGVFDPYPGVYHRPECLFKLCPTPETCKKNNECQNPND